MCAFELQVICIVCLDGDVKTLLPHHAWHAAGQGWCGFVDELREGGLVLVDELYQFRVRLGQPLQEWLQHLRVLLDHLAHDQELWVGTEEIQWLCPRLRLIAVVLGIANPVAVPPDRPTGRLTAHDQAQKHGHTDMIPPDCEHTHMNVMNMCLHARASRIHACEISACMLACVHA